MANPNHQDWDRFWDHAKTKRSAKISWSKKRILKTIIPFLKHGRKALDAGCGSGFFSNYFCERGMTTVSLDYSDEALAMTRQITGGRSRIIREDLLFDNLAGELGETFDLIFSDGLLEHFSSEKQDKIMQNFKKLLSADGVLVTFVPNRWSPWELIRPLFMPGIEEKPFVLKELVRLNQRNGLHVFGQGGINTFPFAASPDNSVGRWFGMLLYTLAKKDDR